MSRCCPGRCTCMRHHRLLASQFPGLGTSRVMPTLNHLPLCCSLSLSWQAKALFSWRRPQSSLLTILPDWPCVACPLRAGPRLPSLPSSQVSGHCYFGTCSQADRYRTTWEAPAAPFQRHMCRFSGLPDQDFTRLKRDPVGDCFCLYLSGWRPRRDLAVSLLFSHLVSHHSILLPGLVGRLHWQSKGCPLDPDRTMPRQPRCPLDWAAHRSRIEDLYWIHDGKLREVMKIMADAHGFVATQKMYKKYLKDWGLEKNIKTRESIFMIGVAERRRMANKETVFTRHGKPVDLRKLYRFRRRHKLLRDGMTDPLLEAQVSTPPHITYRTPEPDPSTSLLPPQIQHYRDADTSEEDQVAMADSPVSYDIHSEGTPPICDIPWEQPLSVIWPSDETGSDAARPTPTATVAGFIPNAFCAHQMSASPNNLAPHDPSPTPFQTTWVDPTDPPSHGNYPSADGNSFWFLALERPHHAAHMATRELGLEVNGVSCLHSPSLSQVMLDINAFSYPGPTLPLSSGPEAARYAAQDHMALNDAVDKNDLDRVRSLLASGARPNSAACGGVTALHTAAAQGNVEMIKLLLSHGASLDAMTNKKQTVLFFVIRGPGNHLGLCDPLAFPHQSHANIPAPHTDDATVGVIEALFNSPTRWIHLRRSLDKVDQHGVSPLMLAAGRGLDKSAAMLLERGARPDLRDHAGHTALRYAARNQHRGLVRMLLLADPAVAEEGDLWHILKLASKNFAVCNNNNNHATMADRPSRGHVPDGGVRWWDGGGHDGVSLSASNLIAEEMVRLCREMGVLDGLLRLAEQKRKRNVVGLLLGAMRRLDGDGSREGSST